ncbi:sugar transferase [Mangrovimonas sp. DI 80]|uniref:sugar transferase n=1 Tax=Mangrovimonas sp. DI 80 TaxID=1779330 RepID=UPI000975A746|nr:sugar transferase [Mangrovimonas sp. DI 80]OMP31151.1 sugar transferase [Mangrovimonas sp. DI 80]
MLSLPQKIVKRSFDLALSLCLLPIVILPIALLVLWATWDTRQWGLFSQQRVGQYGRQFPIYKIRSLRGTGHKLGNLEQYASGFGNWLRRSKLDEWPQLFNVLIGDMSFVGPRPDVEGFADALQGNDRVILEVKPGITGPATLKYANEDQLLSQQTDPVRYNNEVIWPDKVEINKKYVRNWCFFVDLKYIIHSFQINL